MSLMWQKTFVNTDPEKLDHSIRAFLLMNAKPDGKTFSQVNSVVVDGVITWTETVWYEQKDTRVNLSSLVSQDVNVK